MDTQKLSATHDVIMHDRHVLLMDDITTNRTLSVESPFSHINISGDIDCIKEIMLTSLQNISDATLNQLVMNIKNSNTMDNLLALFPNWQDVVTHSTKALETRILGRPNYQSIFSSVKLTDTMKKKTSHEAGFFLKDID